MNSNLLNCDVFEVLYDILSGVLPKLNVNTPKSHKLKRPIYNKQNDDNVYLYIHEYNGFLKFDLENYSWTYSPFEITVYIADDMEKDQLKLSYKDIDYIHLQLKQAVMELISPGILVSLKLLIYFVNTVPNMRLVNTQR